MMRIITGKARGTRLTTLEGLHTRPTAERTKEAIFSIIQFFVRDKNVLDLFGGSGQMGLEAWSRGAAHVTIVDSSREALAVIRENVKKTHSEQDVTVCTENAIFFLERYRGEPFDLVFLDPPYATDLVSKSLAELLLRGLLREGAIVVCETGNEDAVFSGDASLASQFEVLKKNRYGAAAVTVLCLK